MMSRLVIRVLGPLVVGGVLATGAFAGNLGENSALRYWQAWKLMEDHPMEVIREVSFEEMGAPGWTPPDGLAQEVANFQVPLEMVQEGAALAECDFGIDYSKGVETLLLHLAPARNTAKLLVADARLKLHEGDTEGFTNRIVTTLRLTDDLSNGKTLISALVSRAIFTIIEPQINLAMEMKALSTQQQAEIRDALSGFDEKDPFGIIAGIRGERDVFGAWMRKLVSKIDREELERVFNYEVGYDELSPELKTIFDMFSLTGESVDNRKIIEHWREQYRKGLTPVDEVTMYEQFLTACIATFETREEGRQRLNELGDSVTNGDFGGLTMLLAPALGRVHDMYWQGQDSYETLLEKCGG